MKLINRNEIEGWEHLYRANFINCLSGYKPLNLISTVSDSGVHNVAVFNSVIHIGSNPPLLGFILRPNTVPRNTYDNIHHKGYYTINHVFDEIIADAHHTSAKYPSSVSEFDKTKLEIEQKLTFEVPFVKQSAVKIAMKYKEEYPIKANGTILVIGEIVAIYIDEKLINEDGTINLSKANTAAGVGLDGYVVPGDITRYPYQRP